MYFRFPVQSTVCNNTCTMYCINTVHWLVKIQKKLNSVAYNELGRVALHQYQLNMNLVNLTFRPTN